MTTNKFSLTAMLLLLMICQNSVAPFFIVRRLSSGSTFYHDNPAISPFNFMNSNGALLRLTSRRTPDLPESFSPSAKRFSLSDNNFQAINSRYPSFF